MSSLEYALRYAETYDWAVFPVKYRGKEPIVKGGFKSAVKTREAIERLFRRNANIGISTGTVSGFFVLDIDPRNDGSQSFSDLILQYGDFPNTVTVQTGGGGQHHYFRMPNIDIPCRNGLFPGIDIKGNGGYVVAPPSIHESGIPYSWEQDFSPEKCDIAQAPPWLLDLIKKPSPSITSKEKIPNNDGFRSQSDIKEGSRNNTLFREACSMRAKGMGGEEIVENLISMNQQCDPPLPEAELKFIAASAARYEPTLHNEGNLIDIVVTGQHLRDISAQAMETLLKSNERNLEIFQRGNTLVRVEFDPINSEPKFQRITEDILSNRLARSANWFKLTSKGTYTPVSPQKDVIKDILAAGRWNFPIIEGIVQAPVFAKNGHLVMTPGYDPETRLWYHNADV